MGTEGLLEHEQQGVPAQMRGDFHTVRRNRPAKSRFRQSCASIDPVYNLTNWLIKTWPASSDIVMNFAAAWDRAGNPRRAVRLSCTRRHRNLPITEFRGHARMQLPVRRGLIRR